MGLDDLFEHFKRLLEEYSKCADSSKQSSIAKELCESSRDLLWGVARLSVEVVSKEWVRDLLKLFNQAVLLLTDSQYSQYRKNIEERVKKLSDLLEKRQVVYV